MGLRGLIKEALEQQLNKSLILKEDVKISNALQYHIDNGMTLTENAFMFYSEGYFNLVNEVRELYNKGKIDLNEEDRLMVESDLGKKVKIGKEYIYLDAPYVYETETEEDILALWTGLGFYRRAKNIFKTKEILNWKPTYDLESGILKTIEYFHGMI